MITQLKRYGEKHTEKRNKIVIDTGVLVSAFAFDGVPERAVIKAFTEAEIYVSPALLQEYRDVPLELETKGKITHLQLEALIAGIAAFVANAKVVYPLKRLALCRDAKDNMLLECCFEAKARFLITGDRDLLEVINLPFNLRIITPKEYLI
ncbi:MAG: putative toxin-antitoxin system toxin component, PIN family [Nitrospirae bacterium]|nr:putative toxin-antitoxin system toxin component, PIN family [Nitrospirota bacterium]